VKVPIGTSNDHVWIVSQTDKIILLSQHPTKPLREALARSSILHEHGHMTQHSCCKRENYQTSINARLCLIFEASGNDEDDQCMVVGIVSTRPINQGEQIFISYSGDENIADTWGDIFRCYCCSCQTSCHLIDSIRPHTGHRSTLEAQSANMRLPVHRGHRNGIWGGKSKEPVKHQGPRESAPEKSWKKSRPNRQKSLDTEVDV